MRDRGPSRPQRRQPDLEALISESSAPPPPAPEQPPEQSRGGRWVVPEEAFERVALARIERGRLPIYDQTAGMGLLPLIAFLALLELADVRWAIGVSLAVALVVFAVQRRLKRSGGLVFKLALLGLATQIGAGIAGIVVESERVFLWQDPVGDFSIAALCFASLVLHWPMIGRFLGELFPRIAAALPADHKVFFWITIMFFVENLGMGVVRVWMLEATDTSALEYALFSRAVGIPFRILLIVAGWWLIRRAIRREEYATLFAARRAP